MDEYNKSKEQLISEIQNLKKEIIQHNENLKNTNNRLFEIENQFVKSMQKSQDPVLLIENDQIIDCNDNAVKLLGYSSKEKFLNFRPSELSPVKQPTGISSEKKALEMTRIALETGHNRFEWTHKKADGTLFPVEVTLTVAIYQGRNVLHTVWRDLTNEKRVKKHLNESENRWKALTQNFDGIIQVLDKEGKIEFMNKVYPQHNLDEVVGESVFNFLDEYSKNIMHKSLKSLLETKQPQSFESNVLFPDGSLVTYEVKLIPQIDQKENIQKIISIVSDITDRKSAEHELKTALEKATESDRLKSAFLASMNHELRTPLNHIIGFSSLIQDMTDDAGVIEFSKIMYNSGKKLLSIIQDILSLAMVDNSKLIIREDVFYLRDLYSELKEDTTEILRNCNKEELIDLEFQFDSKLATKKIISDKNKILTLITNLIKNSVKFTKKGKISLHFNYLDNNELQISLADTGIGIPKDKLNYIFYLFRQLDDGDTKKYEGIGLGLAISEKIAQAMGGYIYVESEVGKGSIFTFQFPIKITEHNDDESERELSIGKLSDNINLDGFKILISEDDISSRLLVSKILTDKKCNVIEATNGSECINLFKNQEDIDLILMDINMPVLNGLSATEIIRENNRNLPIIAMTAFTAEEDRKKAINAGCNDFITKPINRDKLIKTIYKYLKKNSNGSLTYS